MPQHRLRGQAHLAEQALRAAAREIKHRFGIDRGGGWIADDRDVVFVFYVKQSAGGFLGQVAWHFLVHKMDDLRLDRCLAHAGRRGAGLTPGQHCKCVVGHPLQFHAHPDHQTASQLDGLRARGIEHEHRRRIPGAEAFLAHFAQQIAHIHRHFTKIDVHRAWR